MPTRIGHIYVLTADRSGEVEGIGDIRMLCAEVTERGRIAAGRGREEETLTLTLVEGAGTLDSVKALAYGMVLDVVTEIGAPAIANQYVIRKITRPYHGAGNVVIEAEAYWTRLKGSRVYRAATVDGIPATDRVFSVVRVTPAAMLERIMESAPDGFYAGSVTGLTADQQAALVSLDFVDATHLQAIEALCEAIKEKTGAPCEWDVRRVGNNYYIDLTEQIGYGGNTYVRAGGGSSENPSNRLELVRVQHGDEYFSRLSAVMGDATEHITLGQDYTGKPIFWPCEAVSATKGLVTYQLPGRPVPYDGWGTTGPDPEQPEDPHYFGTPAEGFYRIVSSAAPGQIVLQTGYADLTGGYFARDAAGTPLDFIRIQRVEADYGVRERSVQIEGVPVPNLIREGGDSDDMSEWETNADGDLMPRGWQRVGAPTVEQVVDERIKGLSGEAMRVTCTSVGQGVRVGYYEPRSEYLSGLIHALLDSGEIRLRLIDEEGNYFPRTGDAITNARTLQQLAVGTWSATEGHPFKGLVGLEVTATRPDTVFIIAAATLTPSNGSYPWSDVMGGRDLWAEAGRIAVAEGGAVYSEYQGQSVDLEEIALGMADRLTLGAVVTLQDGYDGDTHAVNIATRVMGYEKRIIPEAYAPRWVMERVRDDLADLLVSGRRPSPGRKPPAPTRPAELPRLLVERVDGVEQGGAEGAQFFFFPKTPSGEDMENYEVFVSVNDADFVSVGTDEDRLTIKIPNIAPGPLGFIGWRSVTLPLFYFHAYPPPEAEYPDFLRFYVVDRATGARSSEHLATVINPRIDVSRLNGQITADLLIEAAQSYGKTFRFSSIGWNEVVWTSGTLTFVSGASYAIEAGTTGLMLNGVDYYVYFDPEVSTTELQVTTDPADWLQPTAVLLSWCHAAARGLHAFFSDPVGGLSLTGEHLSPEAVTTGALAANAVTTVKLDVTSLAALFAVIADLTIVDELVIGAGGEIKSSGYNEGDQFGFRITGAGGGSAYFWNASLGSGFGILRRIEIDDGVFESYRYASLGGGVVAILRIQNETIEMSGGGTGSSLTPSSWSCGGTISAATGMSVGGYDVWHAGNFDPENHTHTRQQITNMTTQVINYKDHSGTNQSTTVLVPL